LMLIVKSIIVYNSEGHKLYKSKSHYLSKSFVLNMEIVKTIIISFGSGLSINLSLISLEALIPGGISTNFLFTYRVGALVCEIISIPVIIRVPEFTRLIASDDKQGALHLFLKYYKQSIFCCIIFMLTIFSCKGVWNNIMPNKLNLVNRLVLLSIFGGWFFERVSTLLAQYYLSSKVFELYKYYILYGLLIVMSVCLSIFFSRETLLSYSLLLINAFLSVMVLNNFRMFYAR
jgi:hypothetical protein